MTNTTYSTHVLEQIKGDFVSGIEQFIINDLESYGNEWYTYLQDVLNHGCVSGTVSSLIYYSDTEKFHDEYEDEIDSRIEEYLENTGEKFSDLVATINFDAWDIAQLKNWKAWFAYEFVASNINRSLEDGEYEDLEEDVATFLDDMIMTNGFEYDEHKQFAIDIFNSVQHIEEDEFVELENDTDCAFVNDANLHSVVEYLLEAGHTMGNIATTPYLTFYYCEELEQYGLIIR